MKKIIIALLSLCFFNAYSQSHRDAIDVINYSINLDISNISSREISGYTQLKVVALESLNTLKLDLFKLTTDSVFVDNQQCTFQQNDTLLTINCTLPLTEDTVEVLVYYHGLPKQDSQWGGFYFTSKYAYNMGVGMGDYPHGIGRYWYPCIDSFTERATYDFHIKTSENNMAVCSGVFQQMSIDNVDQKPIYSWKLDQTIPTYLSSVAVGPYIKISDVYEGVERNIPISIYAEKADSSGATKTFENLKETLEVFETSFGPYKWDRVGYVVVPFSGGAMEHATNIAFPQYALTGSISDQNLAAHELGHSWFGNLVTCSKSEEMWLNEGWASYTEAIFKEHVFGKKIAQSHINSNHLFVIKSVHLSDGDYFTLNDLPHYATYGKHAYDKGADVVHSLRGYLGDELFFKGIKAYMSDFEFSHASSNDLMQSLTQSTGVDMLPFFSNWVFQPGSPHYTADLLKVDEGTNGFEATLNLSQKLKFRDEYGNKNRVPVSFMNAQWLRFDTVVEFNGASEQIKVDVPFNPTALFTDLDYRLNDATTHTSMVIKETGYQLFKDCEFRLNTIEVQDSNLINVIYNWVLPSPVTEEISGVTLSNYHFWKIEGLHSQNFIADGKFSYYRSKNTNPDDNYEIGATDTLVLLYRANANQNWKVVQKGTKVNVPVYEFYLEHVKFGEYAVGYWDGVTDLGLVINNRQHDPVLNIFPNPFGNKCSIDFGKPFTGNLLVYDLKGRLQYKKMVQQKTDFVLHTQTLDSGLYFLEIENYPEFRKILVKE